MVGETDEVHNVQDAVNLKATASLANANNYALYAAAILAGCTNFPTAASIGHGDNL
ncbi:hypothetical protein MMC08_005040 [Hypocenomyce scalaris]|nr:hypothetical protein [Hypocenomyce scalaris]